MVIPTSSRDTNSKLIVSCNKKNPLYPKIIVQLRDIELKVNFWQMEVVNVKILGWNSYKFYDIVIQVSRVLIQSLN